MSDRYPGGIIIKNPTAPTTTVASGIWTLEQQAYYKAQGTWPLPPYFATNSLRIRASASAYLSRTPASAGNQQKWTWSGWVKRANIGSSGCLFGGGTSGSAYAEIYFSGDYFAFYNNLNATANVATNAVYRDPSSWYHLVVAVDTTQATNSDRIKLYVNGVQQTSLSSSTYPAQNTNMYVNSAAVHSMGALYYTAGTIDYFDGYLAEVNFVDGQQLTPSSFGITSGATGVWQPKLYTGSYGTNGFYLPFSDIALTSGSNAGLGKDFSGNGNYWTTNNISVTSGSTYDAMTDVPTLTSATAGNYCVLNPLNNAQGTLSNANLTYESTGDGTGQQIKIGSLGGLSSGKWYFEVKLTAFSGGADPMIGFLNQTLSQGITNPDGNSNAWLCQCTGSYVRKKNGGSNATIFAYASVGDTVGIAVDLGTSSIWMALNGTWAESGDPATGTNAQYTNLSGGPFYPFVRGAGPSGKTSTLDANFGQRPFTYTPPSGFNPINTYNLPTPTILQGDDYFAATLYTGTGSSQSITNTGFQPDLVWTKSRSNAYNNTLVDAVRGVSRSLVSDLTAAEDYSPGAYVTAFNSNGFSVGTGTGSNGSGATYVAWQWKGNGSGSSNTDGTITSTVSANQTAGFSVVTWTGNGSNSQSVGHGLGVTPLMVIIKARSTTSDWVARTTVIDGSLDYLILNTTAAAANSSDSAPTSTVINISNTAGVNTNGVTYVAYCFAPISGYSATGTYTGNGSSDGPFIYTGFRPAYVLVKGADYVTNWNSWDAARNTYNWTSQVLRPNSSAAEFNGYTSVGGAVNLLSNGFQIVKSDGDVNNSGSNFIYMAFAENPFKYALAR